MSVVDRMSFGIFLAPFHPLGENPTLALERDFELIELLDRLGYDEAWIGEHHSAGWELIASPRGRGKQSLSHASDLIRPEATPKIRQSVPAEFGSLSSARRPR